MMMVEQRPLLNSFQSSLHFALLHTRYKAVLPQIIIFWTSFLFDNYLNIQILFRFLVPSFQKADRYNLALNITGKNFSRVIHNYFDVFALSDSDIDTRFDQGTNRPFIFPSTIMAIVVITILVSLAIFLLITKRISEKRIARWQDRLSSDNKLN